MITHDPRKVNLNNIDNLLYLTKKDNGTNVLSFDDICKKYNSEYNKKNKLEIKKTLYENKYIFFEN